MTTKIKRIDVMKSDYLLFLILYLKEWLSILNGYLDFVGNGTKYQGV
jgi:hypothetical protein